MTKYRKWKKENIIFKNNCQYISSLIFNVTLLIKVLFVCLTSNAHSHEVTPAIADILEKKRWRSTRNWLNIEALLSGIDLSNVSNTDESKQSTKYDFYRSRSDIDLKSISQKYGLV